MSTLSPEWMRTQLALHGGRETDLAVAIARAHSETGGRMDADFFGLLNRASVALGEGPFCEREGPFPRTQRLARALYQVSHMRPVRDGWSIGRSAVRESVPASVFIPLFGMPESASIFMGVFEEPAPACALGERKATELARAFIEHTDSMFTGSLLLRIFRRHNTTSARRFLRTGGRVYIEDVLMALDLSVDADTDPDALAGVLVALNLADLLEANAREVLLGALLKEHALTPARARVVVLAVRAAFDRAGVRAVLDSLAEALVSAFVALTDDTPAGLLLADTDVWRLLDAGPVGVYASVLRMLGGVQDNLMSRAGVRAFSAVYREYITGAAARASERVPTLQHFASRGVGAGDAGPMQDIPQILRAASSDYAAMLAFQYTLQLAAAYRGSWRGLRDIRDALSLVVAGMDPETRFEITGSRSVEGTDRAVDEVANIP